MVTLSETTTASLLEAGWTSSRLLDLSNFSARLNDEGYSLLETAAQFLGHYGNLKLRIPQFGEPNRKDTCHFFWERALVNVARGNVSEVERFLSECVVPIGEIFSDHMVLLMSESGAVYACFDQLLLHCGDSGIEMLNSVCEGRELPIMPFEWSRSQSSSAGDTVFSRQSEECLIAGGWRRGRVADIAEEIYRMESSGYKMFPQLVSFLREFSGVVLSKPLSQENTSQNHCIFSPLVAVSRISRESVSEIESLFDMQFVPVGIAFNGTYVLLAGSTGVFVACLPEIPDQLLYLGDTVFQTVNNLCEGRELVTFTGR